MLSRLARLFDSKDSTKAEKVDTLTPLCDDVCMIIIEFVGPSAGAKSLALTSSQWNDYVRHSPIFHRHLRLYYRNQFMDAQSKHEGEDPLDVDWRQYLPKIQKKTSTMKAMKTFVGGVLNKAKRNRYHALVLGVDGGGKTTLLFNCSTSGCVKTTPIYRGYGIYVESTEYRQLQLTSWDVGGSAKIEGMVSRHYGTADAIVFIVDGDDRDQMDNAKYELDKILCKDELREAKLLVLVNKYDLPNVQMVAEVTEKIGLHALRNRNWYIQGCSVLNDAAGVHEGFDWLITNLNAAHSS